MLALRWRTVTASDHPLLILLRSNNWCLNINIRMNYHNGYQLKTISTNEDKERLVTWHCWLIDNWTELVKDHLNIRWWSHRFCDIDFKEVVIWNLIVRSDSCDWRCGRSCWAGFREKRRWSDEHLSRRRWSEIEVEVVKDRLQVAICEPVEVDDDGDIFGRQRIKGTDNIFVR